MKVLAVTNLFPNARQPNRGVFNLQQFEALSRLCELRVVAPLPWQPWSHGLSRPFSYAEEWRGIPTVHPFYFHTPCVGRAAYAFWFSLSLHRALCRLAGDFRPDVLLGTWAYPDTVATTLMARRLGLPFVAKVHGSDINVVAEAPVIRAQIRWALRQAACVFAVSRPMKERLVDMGIPSERVHVQYNGVHVDQFCLLDRQEARDALGLPQERPILLYVGNLEVIKGVRDLVEAARLLGGDAARLPLIVIVGGGRLRGEIEERIRSEALADRLLLVGPRPHGEVPRWMAAADAFCLPSHHEGCPNVVLEAMACGRPVVATRVGAVPEMVDERCGRVVPPGEPGQLAVALRDVTARSWDPGAIRERVLPLSWEASALALYQELERASRGGKRAVLAVEAAANGRRA